MQQETFLNGVIEKVKDDTNVVGLAVAGSFITNEIDEYSDVDLILVTREAVSPDIRKMERYAKSFGNYLNGFTGEHVGERRALICLYDDPLLHVDIKFLTIDEFYDRIEDPVILFDREGLLKNVVLSTKSEWPRLDYQWIEDRFWVWVHYAALKLGRGEYFEALDFLSFLRTTVTSPLLQQKNGKLPRGLRKVEFNFTQEDLQKLVATVPNYSPRSIFTALDSTIQLYVALRKALFPEDIELRIKTQTKATEYLRYIEQKVLGESARRDV